VEDEEVPERRRASLEGANFESSIAGRQQHEVNRAVWTSPNLLEKEKRQPRFSDDPLGQLDPISPPAVTQSVPSLTSVKQSRQGSPSNASEFLLNRYDFGSQIHLLRGHFCRSEVCEYLFVPI
jgi:phosphatidylinositol 4-kinase